MYTVTTEERGFEVSYHLKYFIKPVVTNHNAKTLRAHLESDPFIDRAIVISRKNVTIVFLYLNWFMGNEEKLISEFVN